MKRFLIVLALLFLSGVLVADLCIGQLQRENIWMNLELFKAYAYSNVTFKEVIWNMLYERGKLMIALIILGITPLRERLPIFFLSLFSFCFGFFLMSCVSEIGFIGIVVALASVIPHGFFYVGAFVALTGGASSRGDYQNNGLRQAVVTYLFAGLLFITGCVMECVMGVHFIPWVIRLSFV